MDKMKKQIERRMWVMWAAFFALVLLSAYESMGPGFPVSSGVNEHVLAFQHGLRFGATMVLLAFIVRYVLALRDENKLKKLYYRMTDERMATARMKSGAPALLGCAIALLVASMVAMYLSTAVSVTLIACALFLLVVAVAGKAFWTARIT